MPQRTCGHLHAGDALVRHVTAQFRTILVKGLQALNGEETAFGKNRIECASGVALAEHETIASGPA